MDEKHPCRPDEPYGLSKQCVLEDDSVSECIADVALRICEMQADTIVRRYPFMRVASLRLHWYVFESLKRFFFT